MAEEDEKDYEVGYKKPPKHGQFQPGQSGNPAGRPARSRNMKRLVQELLDEKVELTENGETLVVSKREALVRRMYAGKMVGYVRPVTQRLESLLSGLFHWTSSRRQAPMGCVEM
jgi:hypothetical protein